MAKPVKKPHTWTVADAKARLSELLRLCLLYTSPSPRD